MFCYNNVLMFSPMGGKERTSVYLVGWGECMGLDAILERLGSDISRRLVRIL